MTTAYSYVRFSTKKQQWGDSLRRQLEGSRNFAKSKGWILNETLQPDKGVSAWKGKNKTEGSLYAFLQMIEDGHIAPGSILIVEAMDRLSREQISRAAALFLNIINAGVSIATLIDNRVYSEKDINENIANFYIVIGLIQAANEYSNKLSHRITSVMQNRRNILKAGGKAQINGKPPFWISKDVNGEWALNDKAGTVKQMVQWAMAGKGQLNIANSLTKMGVKTHSGKTVWNDTTCYKMLRSATLMGTISPKNHEPIKSYYPALITEQEFYALQGVLNARKQVIKGRHGNHTSIFGDLITMADTGKPMSLVVHSFADKKRKNFYNLACTEGTKGRGEPRSIAYEPVEKAFLDILTELDISGKKKQPGTGVNRAALISDKQKRLAAIQSMIESGDISQMQTLAKSAANIETQIQILKAENEKDMATQATPQFTFKDVEALVNELMDTTPKPTSNEILEKAMDKGEMRRKIRVMIRQIVKGIRLWVCGNTVKRAACIVVELMNGELRIGGIKTERNKPYKFWWSSLDNYYSGNYDFAGIAHQLLEGDKMPFQPTRIEQ